MADDVDKIYLAFERVLESFKLQNLKDSQREALQNLVKGQDVFVIQPTGSGKSLIFQSAPIVFDTVRPLTNAKSIALVISPLASLMQDQVRYLKSGNQGRVYRGWTGKRRGQATTRMRGMPNRVWLTRGIFVYQKMAGNAQQGCLQKEVVFGCSWWSSLYFSLVSLFTLLHFPLYFDSCPFALYSVFQPENSAWGPKWPLQPIFGGQIFQERANVPVSL